MGKLKVNVFHWSHRLDGLRHVSESVYAREKTNSISRPPSLLTTESEKYKKDVGDVLTECVADFLAKVNLQYGR